MPAPSPLLLVYDAESAACRARVDWIRTRDREGLIVAFPIENPELLRLAPELAGIPLQGELHALDTRTRKALRGPDVMPAVFHRLPALRWAAPLLKAPGLAAFAYRMLA